MDAGDVYELCDLRWAERGESFGLPPRPEKEEGICRCIMLQYADLLSSDSFSDIVIL